MIASALHFMSFYFIANALHFTSLYLIKPRLHFTSQVACCISNILICISIVILITIAKLRLEANSSTFCTMSLAIDYVMLKTTKRRRSSGHVVATHILFDCPIAKNRGRIDDLI